MSIVIDINAFPSVFFSDCVQHSAFMVVKQCIDDGKCKIVYGGTKYLEELGKAPRYLNVLTEYSKKRKTVLLDKALVDVEEIRIKNHITDSDCDDHHIIAILSVSRCPWIVSLDARSYRFIKDRSNYGDHMPKVRIYTSLRNSRIFLNSIT